MVENADGYDRFLSAIAYIVEALEVIAHNNESLNPLTANVPII